MLQRSEKKDFPRWGGIASWLVLFRTELLKKSFCVKHYTKDRLGGCRHLHHPEQRFHDSHRYPPSRSSRAFPNNLDPPRQDLPTIQPNYAMSDSASLIYGLGVMFRCRGILPPGLYLSIWLLIIHYLGYSMLIYSSEIWSLIILTSVRLFCSIQSWPLHVYGTLPQQVPSSSSIHRRLTSSNVARLYCLWSYGSRLQPCLFCSGRDIIQGGEESRSDLPVCHHHSRCYATAECGGNWSCQRRFST